MFSLRKPSAEFIRRFLTAQSGLDFTYAAVGATQSLSENRPKRGGQAHFAHTTNFRSVSAQNEPVPDGSWTGSETQAPAGYVVDHTRVKLGEGEAAFKAAAAGLRRWEQFRLGWLSASPGDTPIEPGQCVAVVARALGLWCLNAARVVYVVDEPRRFGFAYGTLPGHVESGEERFLIELADDDCVWYDILAFSRPNHFLTRLGYPFVRRLQKRFGRDSAAAMVRVVQAG